MELPIVADLTSIKVVIHEGRAAFGVGQQVVPAETDSNTTTDSRNPIASEVASVHVTVALVEYNVVVEISGRERAVYTDDEPGTELKIVTNLASAEKATPFELEGRIRFVQLKKA